MEERDCFINEVKRCVLESEKILIGLGEDLQPDFRILLDRAGLTEKYNFIVNNDKIRWIIPYFHKYIYDKIWFPSVKESYNHLKKLLEGKDFYLISLLTDDVIYNCNFPEDRIVTPLGGYRKLRCENDCEEKFYEIQDRTWEDIVTWIEKKNEVSSPKTANSVCSVCGKPLLFDLYGEKAYSANGYMHNWNEYQKWIQGTMNKKLCILEIGVGMMYPSIVRWPFERLCNLNIKCQMFRIHETLYHVSKENRDRSQGFQCNPMDLLKLV